MCSAWPAAPHTVCMLCLAKVNSPASALSTPDSHLQARSDVDAKRARLAKLRGTPGVREERVAEAERDLGNAQQQAEAAKATYEVRAVVTVLHRPGAAQVDGMLVATAVGARFAGVGALAIAVLSSLGPLQASLKLAIPLPRPHPLHPSLLPQTIVQRMGAELDRFQRERAQEMGWVTPILAAGVLQQVSSAVHQSSLRHGCM